VIPAPTPLTPAQRTAILQIARRAIRERVSGRVMAGPAISDPVLQAPGAAFVTLTRSGALRGCIGFVQAVQPLGEAVAHCAAAAATEDPRFSPVKPEDLPELQLEISVLSPLVRAEDPAEIQVGLHGLHISRGGRRGLLLPQVATEHGWNRETFLRQTCRKAGLPDDAWQRGAEIHVFTVDHFSDGQPVSPPLA
jgi:AmmeMemoRadiSam system protein A